MSQPKKRHLKGVSDIAWVNSASRQMNAIAIGDLDCVDQASFNIIVDQFLNGPKIVLPDMSLHMNSVGCGQAIHPIFDISMRQIIIKETRDDTGCRNKPRHW